MNLRDIFKRRRAAAPVPPECIKLDGASLAAFGFGVLAYRPFGPEGHLYYDVNAAGRVESRIPTPWPNWSDPDWTRTSFAANGASRAAEHLLFGEREEVDDA